MGEDNSKGDFEQYWRHASTLRNWYVIYGVGALALIFSSNNLFIQNSLNRKLITELILWAVGMQITLALINKVSHWYEARGNALGKFFANLFLIDLIFDCVTFGFFAWAARLFLQSV